LEITPAEFIPKQTFETVPTVACGILQAFEGQLLTPLLLQVGVLWLGKSKEKLV